MKSYISISIVALLIALLGCSGGNSSSSDSSSSSGVSVTIDPTSATVATGLTKQFTAKVTNASNTNITWRVNGATGGNSTYGTITGTGLYTAPSTVPTDAKVTITAMSVADTNKTADATVNIAKPIAVSPDTVSVEAAQTYTFTATVSFSTNTGVSWRVNGISGGNTTIGTIDSSGKYTAPNAVPATNPVSVTAIANADNSQTASATVTITPPEIVISPTTVTLAAGAQQTFTATVLSNTVHPVWSLACNSPTAGACGSITSDGTYTAPATPPRSAQVKIWASMADGSAASENATATIQFATPSLSGQYVFTIADTTHAAPSQAGTVLLDGAGHVSSGLLDSTDSPGNPAQITAGTYQVGSDGRGSMTIQLAAGATENFVVALSTNQSAFIVRVDSAANQASGTLEQQQSVSAVPTGSYVIASGGAIASPSGVPVYVAGSIAVNDPGGITAGIIDTTQNAIPQTIIVTGGSLTSPSVGRGVLTILTASASQNFAYFPIDPTRAKLVALDGSSMIGEMTLQPSGPFSSSSLNGAYVFSLAGSKAGSPFGLLGVFSATGFGSLADVLFDGLPQTVFDFNPGAYTLTDSTTGRMTATWTANSGSKLQYVLYPRNDGSFIIIENDGTYAASGIVLPQTPPAVGNFVSLGGAFALRLAGVQVSTSAPAAITAQVLASTSVALSGTADSALIGQGSELSLNLATFTAANQRYVFGVSSDTLSGGPLILYRANDDQAFAIIANQTVLLTGILTRQY